MRKISYAGHRFPPDVIQQAVWLYLRFALSYRDGVVTLSDLETLRSATCFMKRQPPHTIH